MNVAAIACANGLGHIKRVIKIGNRLLARAPELSISLLCEAWQVEQLAGWEDFRQFAGHPGVQLLPTSLPLRWSPDPGYYGSWLMDWHSAIAAWHLERYDQVLSDNLVEPLHYSDRVTLSGSFLWHDVLAAAFPDHPVVISYRNRAAGLMRSAQPPMLVNRYFAMPAAKAQAKAVEVGLINFCAVPPPPHDRLTPQRVLVALGSTASAGELLEQVEEVLPLLRAGGMTLLAGERWHETLAQMYRPTELYDFVANPLHTVDLAIIRAGLGTISDCVAARVPMLTVADSNPEINHNQARLVALGIGLPLAEATTGGAASPLTNHATYRAMLGHFDRLDLHGEEEAANFLLTHWGVN